MLSEPHSCFCWKFLEVLPIFYLLCCRTRAKQDAEAQASTENWHKDAKQVADTCPIVGRSKYRLHLFLYYLMEYICLPIYILFEGESQLQCPTARIQMALSKSLNYSWPQFPYLNVKEDDIS